MPGKRGSQRAINSFASKLSFRHIVGAEQLKEMLQGTAPRLSTITGSVKAESKDPDARL